MGGFPGAPFGDPLGDQRGPTLLVIWVLWGVPWGSFGGIPWGSFWGPPGGPERGSPSCDLGPLGGPKGFLLGDSLGLLLGPPWGTREGPALLVIWVLWGVPWGSFGGIPWGSFWGPPGGPERGSPSCDLGPLGGPNGFLLGDTLGLLLQIWVVLGGTFSPTNGSKNSSKRSVSRSSVGAVAVVAV